MLYEYTARDRRSRVVRGELEAENEQQLRNLLRERGIYVTKVKPRTAQARVQPATALFSPKVKLDDLVVFSRQFATLTRAGLNLTAVMDTLRNQTTNVKMQQVLTQIQQDVQSGESLGNAFARHEKIFTPIFVSLVAAGEAGGVLDEILDEVAIYFEKEQDLRQRIRSAFAYPTVVMVVATLIVIFLLWKVVPVFEKVYSQLNVPLPLPTIILVQLGKFMQQWVWLVFLSLAGLFLFYQWFKNSKTGKPVVDRLKLQMPLFANLNLKTSLTRFTRTFALLVRAGVPILQALQTVSSIRINFVIMKAISEMQDGIREGESVAAELRKRPIFPPLLVQMAAVGEETGNMEEAFFAVADYYEREVDYLVRRLTSVLEPALTVILGVIVGFIALALYLPIFNVVQAIR